MGNGDARFGLAVRQGIKSSRGLPGCPLRSEVSRVTLAIPILMQSYGCKLLGRKTLSVVVMGQEVTFTLGVP